MKRKRITDMVKPRVSICNPLVCHSFETLTRSSSDFVITFPPYLNDLSFFSQLSPSPFQSTRVSGPRVDFSRLLSSSSDVDTSRSLTSSPFPLFYFHLSLSQNQVRIQANHRRNQETLHHYSLQVQNCNRRSKDYLQIQNEN